MIADGVMTSYRYYKRAAEAYQIYFRFLVWPRLTFEKAQSYRRTAYQISTKYLNPRPRYYYFRFLKINNRHIESLLPVSISTFSLNVILHWPTNF